MPAIEAGPLRLSARPTNLVVEAPIVKPTLMPDTVNGYRLPRKHEHALAATDSDDEPALGEDDGNLAGFGSRWRAEASHAHEQGNQGNAYTKLFHDVFPLKRRDATTTYWVRSLAKYLNTVSRMADTA